MANRNATEAKAIESEVQHAQAAHTWCWKCGGAGRLTWTSYANGVCFACKGSGRVKPGDHNPRTPRYTNEQALAAFRASYRVTRGDEEGRDSWASHDVAFPGPTEALTAEQITAVLSSFVALGKLGAHVAGYVAWCACTMPRWYVFTAAQQRALLPFLAQWGCETEESRVPHRIDARGRKFEPCPAGSWHFTGEYVDPARELEAAEHDARNADNRE